MKLILDDGQEICITWDHIIEGEQIQEVPLPNGDLLFIQRIESWCLPQKPDLQLRLPIQDLAERPQ